jgi:hypothetical protein
MVLMMLVVGLVLVSRASADTSNAAGDPTTVEAAMKVLDLRTFPVLSGAEVSESRSLGMLMYEAKGTPKAAFDFQRKELSRLGFKEMPGGYSDENNNSGHFTKDGFVVAVSTYPVMGEPEKEGWSSVTLVNRGNVALDKLPVPPGTKPFYPNSNEASYTTTAGVAETAAACRKLLLATGWEPYGQAGLDANQPDTSMQYFKKNAIKLQSWVMKTPAEGGKTLIRYSADLMSADLPAPPDATDPRYDDSNKKLDMDEPIGKTDAILAFYQERLPKMGWKATTERPVVDERTKSQFLIFRNAQKDLLSLDLKQYSDIVRVKLQHQTEAEVAEEEKRAKAYAAKKQQEEMERNQTFTIFLPIPANAREVEHSKPNIIEFRVKGGAGPATLEALRAHFKKDGWTEEEGAKLEKNTGEVTLQKEKLSITCRYFDIGIGGAEISVWGAPNVIFEAKPTNSKAGDTAGRPKAEKKKPSAIPGLPKLPAGVELPKEAQELLKEAQEEIDKIEP